jgi:hypothetical protein
LELSTKKSTPKKSKAETEKKSTNLIYVGPSLPNGLLTKFTVFSNGIPEHVKKDYEEKVFFKKLFVPIGQFAAVEKDLANPSSALSVFSKKTLEYFSRKG